MDAERMSTSLLARPCSGPGEKGDHLNNNKNLNLEVIRISTWKLPVVRDGELDDGRRSLDSGVICTLMEMGWGRASPLALSAAGCSDRKKGSPPGDGGVKAFYRHLLGQ